MVVENGRIRELDFNPEQTEQPLPANWVDSIRNHEELEELGLFNTSVTESAVIEALEHLPHLRRLNLANTQVTDALANALSRGLSPNLEQLCIDNSWTAASARAILAQARPELYVG
jgi:Leucine-rich repeat (LRR) protein